MVKVKQIYRSFLQDNFAGLRLRKPLFYSWDFGLRFDLEVENSGTKIEENDEYFTEIISRATQIFEAAFNDSDSIIFIFMDRKWRQRKIKYTNYAFRQIEKLNRNEIFYTKEKEIYYPTDAYNYALIKLTTDRIKYKNILTAIMNNSFLFKQPRLENDTTLTEKTIFFLNLDKKLIFHMYDNRGLDIISAKKEILHPIYKKHNEWLLEYDRDKMDKMFK